MGKGKKGAKKAAEMGLTTMTESFNPNDAQDPFDRLDMCLEVLEDRRCASRELAMAALCGALEGFVPLDELDSRCLAIFEVCGVSIKKGSAKEARLAYRTVGLLALTLCDGAPDFLAEAFPMVSRAVQVQASLDDAPTLVAALECLAAITFAGARDVEEAEKSLKVIWAVIFPPISECTTKTSGAANTSSQAVAAAVAAWTFLVTNIAMTDEETEEDLAAWAATVASLAGLLEHDDRTVRMAAGQALAVCVENNLAQGTPCEDMEALEAKVSDLATEPGGKGLDKKMLPEQRDLFRQIAAFLDHGEEPKMLLGISSNGVGALKVSTWAKMVQVNFLRSFLGGGFLEHVKCNALFKEIFCISDDEGRTMSMFMSMRNSKARQKDLNLNRDIAWERKNFLY